MSHFVVIAEGESEQLILPSLLRQWLATRLQAPPGVRSKHGGKGVRHYLDNIARWTQDILTESEADRDVLLVVGVVDLYHLPLALTGGTPPERAAEARQRLEAEIGSSRFCQAIAVHEFEAWLLADPTSFPVPVRSAITRLGANPEHIDDQTPPAKHLDRCYRAHLKRSYRKVVDGPRVAAKLDPTLVYSSCPHFRQLCDALLSAAVAAGCQPLSP